MMGRILALLVVLGGFSLMFNNCGANGLMSAKQTGSPMIFASGGICLDQLKAVYQQTYFPFLSTTCNACHGAAQGSTNLNVSFAAFQERGVALIDLQSTTPHGGNSLGAAEQAKINAFKPTWNAGQAAYASCLANETTKSPTGSPTGAFDVELVAKAIPNIENTRNNANTYVQVSWNISQEVAADANMGKYQATLRVEARYFMNGDQAVGFLFRNPTLITTAGPISLGGLGLKVAGQEITSFTTYQSLNQTIATPGTVNLAPGAGAAIAYYENVTSTTPVAFVLHSITNSAGGGAGAVRFADLVGTDPSKSIFRNSCVTCHSAANPQAGLNLNDYNSARDRAAQIMARINNAAAPMPQTGLLPQAQRDIIQSWIDAGTPQ